MKIAIISAVALRTGTGGYSGLERVAFEHSKGLEELGHDVTLIASKDSKAPAGVKLVETVKSWDSLIPAQQQMYAKDDGVDREVPGIGKWKAHTWNAWRQHEQEAYKEYSDDLTKFDVIVDNSWSKFSLLSKKDQIISVCHSMQPYQIPPPMREFPQLCGVSKGHARVLTARMHKPHRFVWNPVTLDEFQLQTSKEERVISLNRIMPQKGIHLFLDMIEKVNAIEGQRKFKADLVGDDSTLVPDQGYVQLIKDRCKKSAYVDYYGLVDDRTRVRLLQRAKVAVCMKDGGYEEVFGLSAVEAMAVGTPVVAMRSWGYSDTIDEKSGILCDNIEEVSTAVRKIMNEEIKFDPQNCRNRSELFSRKIVSKFLSQMCESVKGGSRW